MDLDKLLYRAAWLSAQYQLEEAWQLLSAGLQYWPDEPRLLLQRGEVLKQAGAVPDAIEDFEEASELYADSDDRLAYARTHSRLLLLRWSQADNWEEISAELRFYNSQHLPDTPKIVPLRDPAPNRRLRIGYVSPDFRVCSAAMLLEMLFLHHPQRDWEVVAYSLLNLPQDLGQQQFRRLLPNWRDLSSLSIEDMHQTIAADQVDILVDLAGHTSLNALPLFGLQPAPIQITGLTFNGPLGMPQMPWRLTDVLATPEPLLDEKPLYCDSWIWWPEPDEIPGRNRHEIPPVAETLGCAHPPARLSEQTLAIWSQLLEELPGARLRLKHPAYASSWCRQHLERRFLAYGIPKQRLEFELGSDYMDYLAWYRGLDLVLDPFPYHGGLVSCEALWMGVPLVTLAGWMRGGESILAQLGWQLGVCVSPNAYLRQALTLATSPAMRLEAAARLRPALRNSSIMRGARLAEQVTDHARSLWEKACAGKR